MRVHELAKELGKPSKEIIEAFAAVGIKVASHNSSIDEYQVSRLKASLAPKKEQKPKLIVRKVGSVKEREKAEAEAKAKEEADIKAKEDAKIKAEEEAKAKAKAEVLKKKELEKAEQEAVKVVKKPEEPKKVKQVITIGEAPKKEEKKTEEAKKEPPKKKLSHTELKELEAKRKAEREAKQKAKLEKKRAKKDKRKRKQVEEVEQVATIEEPGELRIIKIDKEQLTLKDISELVNVSLADIMREVLLKGMMLNLNSEVDFAMAAELVTPFNVILEKEEAVDKKQEREEEMLMAELEEKDEDLETRPPVITIMGHVDHGKTKLLDTIRKANVVDKEAGGITQHMGAYQVVVDNKQMTFIDTPGHEAFTEIRARGAQVTDIVILIVAADDGIKPQTIEAIHHAKAAAVPIIVAINKIDKPDSDPDRVKQQLTEHELVPEEWGGDTVCVPISALTGKGVNDLLDMINLVAEMKDLKANPNREAQGVVIEAKLSKSKGPVATVIIKSGTLNVGDAFVIGPVSGKVRAMHDHNGDIVKVAPPSTPVEILGISQVPTTGDIVQVVANEKEARVIAEQRQAELDTEKMKRKSHTLESMSQQIKEGEINTLNILVKADTQGSVDALHLSLERLATEKVSTHIVHSGTGAITESDIMLAKVSNALVFGFNVTVNNAVREIAEDEGITVKLYSIIYKAIDDVKEVLEGMEKPEYERIRIGTVEIRAIFESSKVGTIAGCLVKDGKAIRNADIIVVRNDAAMYEGKLDSLKRFKDDVKEVAGGYECGVVIKDYDGFQEGDIIEVYETREKKK